MTVAGPEIVGVRLTQAAHAHGLALALPEKVDLARPEGIRRAGTTSDPLAWYADEATTSAGSGLGGSTSD